jgi:hypothetical protein
MPSMPDARARVSPSSAQAPWFRWGLRAVQIAVVALVAYMVILNVFLGTSLLRRITNSAGRVFHLDYERAYALVPWRVHAKGIRIRAADSHIEWSLAIDDATFGIHLLRLVHREFRATDVDGDGIAFRVRFLESVPSPAHEARLPEIDGFTDPPLKPMGPPVTVDADRLFSVDLERVDARHVREVWIDSVRFTGDLRIRSSWKFRPLRRLELDPTTVDVRTLDVGPGTNPAFLTGVSGRFDVTVQPYDVRQPSLLGTLRYISLQTDLTGTLRAPDLWKEYGGPSSGIVLPAGEGVATLRMNVDHGVVASGSTAQLDVPELELARSTFDGRGSLHVHASVEGLDDGKTGALDVTLGKIRVGREPLTQARIESLRATLTTRDLDLVKPFGTVLYDATLKGLTAPRADPLTAFLPARFSLTSGLVRADGHIAGSLTEATADGGLTASVESVVLESPFARVTGTVGAHVALASGAGSGGPSDHLTGRVDLRELDVRVGTDSLAGDATLELSAVRSRESSATQLGGSSFSIENVRSGSVRGWWARLTLDDAATKSGPDGMHGKFTAHLEAKDLTPLAPLVSRAAGVPAWLVGLVSMPNARGGGELAFAPGLLDLRGFEMRGGHSSVRLELTQQDGSSRGVALVEVAPFSVGLGLGSETPKVVLLGARSWFEARRADLRAHPGPVR